MLFLQSIFGKDFDLSSQGNRLKNMIDSISSRKQTTPIILWTDKGLDVSPRVDHLAAQTSRKIISVAMGSQEGFALADNALSQGSRNGSWVVIKNAHLALNWLQTLEKKLKLSPESEMRLFITIENKTGVPTNLLRSSRILMFEPTTGIRSCVLDCLQSIPRGIITTGPTEKYRVLFMLSWLHAVLLERLHYIPLGWTKKYDINDSDF